MGLVKCTNCGAMISDSATTCPKCGASTGNKVICKDCNTTYSADADTCPQCGCPNTAKSQQSNQTHNEASESIKKRVQRFLIENRQKFPRYRVNEIRNELLQLSEEQLENVEYLPFKDPSIMLIISVFLGALGVDRFILGDTSNGIFKLVLTLLCGVGVIWWIIDLFKITDLTYNYNYKMLKETISFD